MFDKFNNAFYLIIYLAHFIIVASYAYQLVFDTKKFLKGRGVDKTATLITRFAGSFMVGMVLMAVYIAFIRPGGLEATWAFFNLVFIINISILIINFYSLRVDKTGLTKKTKDDGIYAPLILAIMSAMLCYGLADKIYV
ncbi:hypothetical protein OA496_00130 [Pelagibacteraceae bacterium]|nr:hypothetical protein [Pelagibacteraceae bacterium]